MNAGIYLLLGSNLGHSEAHLQRAAREIDRDAGDIVQRSSVWRSAAWGVEHQPDFYNQALEIASSLPPAALLDKLLEIETRLGRVRAEKWGPRVIDIDIILYGAVICDTPALQLPHPRLAERRFALAPLAEIASDVVHPVLNKPVKILLQECRDALVVERLRGLPPPRRARSF